jgi:radical SAM superfamily enzyme YgiQ (UPF0313 family)
MNRRVTFVVPPRSASSVMADFGGGLGFEALDEYVLPPLDLLQLAACARNAGWECLVVDALGGDLTTEQLVQDVTKSAPDVIVLSSTLPTLSDDRDIAAMLRSVAPRILLRSRSSDPFELLSALEGGFIDSCLVDECEVDIDGILRGTVVEGTARLVDGRIVKIAGRAVDELDSLPFPARDLTDWCYQFPKLGRVATIQTSRGCPYPCGYYCPYPLIQGRKWRARSAHSVGEELAALVASGTQSVLFRDAVFTLDKRRAADICDEINRRNMSFTWWCETRADRLDASLVVQMAAAGCRGINVGVESGDPALRYSQLKRGVTDEVLIDLCTAADQAGVSIAFLMMVGFPGETRDGVLMSGALIERCRPAHIGISFPVHHPGTQFAKDAIANGWVRDNARSSASGAVPVVIADLPAEDMIEGKRLLEELHATLVANPEIRTDEALQQLRTWATDSAR